MPPALFQINSAAFAPVHAVTRCLLRELPGDHARFLFVQAMTANRVLAYVWLVDPTGNTPTGTAQNDVPDPIVVGLVEAADKP
jgi:hypothetical protein